MVKKNEGKNNENKNSACSLFVRGFTLIEIFVVLGIIAIVATLLVSLSFPALAGFACRQEREHIATALVRARFVAELFRAEIYFEIQDSQYTIYRLSDGVPVLFENFEHNEDVPVSASNEIVFHGREVFLLDSDQTLTLGTASSSCHDFVRISRLGVVTW